LKALLFISGVAVTHFYQIMNKLVIYKEIICNILKVCLINTF